MKKIILSVFVLIGGLAFSAAAQTIDKIYLTLDPASNTGKCPRYLKFKAVLLTDRHPGTAGIKWLDANGAVLHAANVLLTSSGQDSTSFILGVPTKITSSISVVTTASKPVQSNPLSYTVTCK